MSDDTLNGIPRVDLHARPVWKRKLAWWAGGQPFSTKAGGAVWRKTVAPIEAPIIKATRGRGRLSVGVPVVVLTSIGARSGMRRETPLLYFTDGDDVILIASNYGRERHPAWYHNLLAHPECELHIGPRGGPFVASEIEGADRDRMYALAVDRLNKGWARYEQRINGIRTIPIMRLTPHAGVANGPGQRDQLPPSELLAAVLYGVPRLDGALCKSLPARMFDAEDKELLGHESIATTERYLAVDDAEIRAAAMAAAG